MLTSPSEPPTVAVESWPAPWEPEAELPPSTKFPAVIPGERLGPNSTKAATQSRSERLFLKSAPESGVIPGKPGRVWGQPPTRPLSESHYAVDHVPFPFAPPTEAECAAGDRCLMGGRTFLWRRDHRYWVDVTPLHTKFRLWRNDPYRWWKQAAITMRFMPNWIRVAGRVIRAFAAVLAIGAGITAGAILAWHILCLPYDFAVRRNWSMGYVAYPPGDPRNLPTGAFIFAFLFWCGLAMLVACTGGMYDVLAKREKSRLEKFAEATSSPERNRHIR